MSTTFLGTEHSLGYFVCCLTWRGPAPESVAARGRQTAGWPSAMVMVTLFLHDCWSPCSMSLFLTSCRYPCNVTLWLSVTLLLYDCRSLCNMSLYYSVIVGHLVVCHFMTFCIIITTQSLLVTLSYVTLLLYDCWSPCSCTSAWAASGCSTWTWTPRSCGGEAGPPARP